MVLSRKPRKERKGQKERKKSQTAQVRQPDLSKVYTRNLGSIEPGEFDFRLDLLGGRGSDTLQIDPYAESLEWVDEAAALTGSVQLRRPAPDDAASLPVMRGMRVRCRVKWQERWFELWTMRCGAPEVDVDTGVVTVSLEDDLVMVRGGRRRYLYRKTKRRSHGWFGHEALQDAARKDGIRLGLIAKCQSRTDKIDVTGSFLDLVVKIYQREHKETGRKFVLRMRNGKFEVVPFRRNKTVYVLAEQIRTASLVSQAKVANPVTVLTGHGRVGKGKDAKKVQHTEYNREMVRRLGFVRKEKNFGTVDSLADLRKLVRRELADNYRLNTTLTVQHQGIPWIRRGDGAKVVLESEGLVDEEAFVFATAARHQVQGGTYTSEWDFTRVDPFAKDEARLEAEQREKARRERKKAAAA